MKLHELSPAPGSVAERKRIGRGHGSGNGKTAGKGHKGQNARSGGGVRIGFEGGQMPLTRRIPKRGFNNIFAKKYSIVNVSDLSKFVDGTVVDTEMLIASGLIKKENDGVKVLGNGELTAKITVKAAKFSQSAIEKIEKAGGKAEVTLFIIIVFRFGSALTVPFLTLSKVQEWMSTNATDGNFLEYLNILTGGALSKATIFSLSITPYINASIIIQLLTYALPPLERLQSEGETGRKKLNQITAFVALGLSIFMSVAYYFTLKNMGAVKYTTGFEGVFAAVVITSCFVAGAMLVVWMGNRINDKGIGNGISMILFAGIVARFPTDVGTLITLTKDNPSKYLFVSIAIAVIYIVMIGFVVFMNESERRIPIQYAKRVVGRKQYGGQSTHIPVKVCIVIYVIAEYYWNV